MSNEEAISHKVAEIAATAAQYPGVIIINNIQTQGVEYMSPWGLELLQITMPELRALGADYHTRFFNPADAAEYAPKIWQLIEQNELGPVATFFQQVRANAHTPWTWYFTSMRLLLHDTQGAPLLLLCVASPVQPETHLAMRVQRLLDENEFLRRNAATFATLTSREREVLRHLALGHSSPQIAQTLHLSVQTAETHRRNIRQKLQPQSAAELGLYARAFNLV
ncbi:helix-turn-helix transcriptional regulator [Hymenobacter lucidus]|uniref:LuxR C-terminal-related transcriptional regulator n=1 Tax=Hymenobacter lucidus TaxID=2880930 RepID=A0ABS8AZG1_9BACT|nr:LuxR C-terminal-related transcriptional regulator [Hymenobacter lucidus]MCB2411178.1 LuxR C-terminal-related transcriptional regulator [Hymenobacter lucidus]